MASGFSFDREDVLYVIGGIVDCARCHQRIEVGQEWDLGHVDGDRLRYAGPEHGYSRDCSEGENRATARHRKLRECVARRDDGSRESGELPYRI
jgi:hypothetical protein